MSDFSPMAQTLLDMWSLLSNKLKADERQRVADFIGGFGTSHGLENHVVQSGKVKSVSGENLQVHSLKIDDEAVRKVLIRAIKEGMGIYIPDEASMTPRNGTIFVWSDDE